jgi:hypothetical protein
MFVNFNILNQLGSPAINSNTFANRPAAGQTGRLFVSTDTFEIYRDNGTTWDLIGGPGSSTITGTGTATQVAYFTSSQAIGSSANLFWDNTNGFLGVATAVPTARIEAVKTDGYGIYANYTTVAGSGSSASAIYAINTTASSGYAAVIEEKTTNTTGGQYPLLVKHSLSSGTAAVGNGTGLQFQLQDDAGTFKTTQLTIETIDAAAATYATRYRFNVQSAGSSTPAAYLNATGLGLGTATPGAKLDIHSTGTLAQFNTTGATTNAYIAFQRTGTGLWRLGDTYNGGNNFFELHNTVLAIDALEFEAATNKSTFQAQQTYSTGLARGNYFDYNLSVPAATSFTSPNAITALGASLDLTLAGNATIPSGARTGLDAYNSVSFTGSGTLTMTQGTQIRPYSNVTAGWAFNGSATGTITHLAGLRVLFPDNTGSAVTVTNNYGLLINDQTANTGTVTYTNRWGIYQEGASDLNYLNANLLLGSTTNTGEKLQVTGAGKFSSSVTANGGIICQGYSFGSGGLNLEMGVTSGYVQLNAYNRTTAAFGSLRLDGSNVILNSSSGSNVGIGTSSPSSKLQISGTGTQQITITSTNAGTELTNFGIRNVSGNLILNSINDAVTASYEAYKISKTSGAFTVDKHEWYTSTGLLRMTLDASGRLGINVSNPATFLHISGSNVANRGQLTIQATDFSQISFYKGATTTTDLVGHIYSQNTGNFDFNINNYTATGSLTFGTNGSTERARFVPSGNFLIGTTTDAGFKLDVTGGNTILRGGRLLQGAAGPVSTTISQQISGTSTAAATTVAKKIIYCDHTHSINVKVIAYQDTSNNASITKDFCASYGVTSSGNTLTTAVGNVTAISLVYNNGGSPAYTIDCTVTYSGTAPTLYIVVSGESRDNMYII